MTARRGLLIVISGLPGVGKTAVASAVATRLDATHLSIDPLEDALLSAGLPSGWTTGVAAYDAVAAMAGINLAAGRRVVVDAVNDSDAARGTWRRVVDAHGAAGVFVVLTCSDRDVHRRRLEGRQRGLAVVAEPTWQQVLDREAEYQPWSDPDLVIDTAHHTIADVGELVCAHVGEMTR
ncbi:AAA family ATPase [Williamsia sp. M5A3_1d]